MLFATALLAGSLLFGSSSKDELMVHFASDVSELDDQAIADLDVFLSRVQLDGDYTFVLRGHTDFEGANSYNEQLARARAANVQAYLVAHGADPSVITVETFGERKPIMSNTTEEGMAENRRVQILFEQHRYNDLDELRKELAEGSVQRFRVDPTQASSVTGTKGMQVVFPVNAFKGANGETITDPVEVQLTEAISLDAMLGHELSTRSGAQLLETAGMMKVEAFDAQGKALALANGTSMQVSIPKNMDQPGMELFTSSDGADWTAVGQQANTATVQTDLFGWEEMRFTVPAWPTAGYPQFYYPLYKEDQNGKPRRPVDPVLPKAPSPPRQESFTPTVRWWQFLAQQAIERKAQERYQRALLAYDKQMERYEKKVEQYEEECASMPERLERYRVDKVRWDELKKTEREEWQKGKSAAAVRHDSIYANEKRRYELALARYHVNYDSLLTAWRAERTQCLEEYAQLADQGRAADISGLSAYVFNATQLGWINCDRFYNVPPEEKYVAQIADTDASREQVYLVFSGLNSIVRMSPGANGAYQYAGVPKKQAAEVFAYKVEGSRAMVCRTPIHPGQKPALTFVKSSFKEIREMLRDLEKKDEA